MRLRRAPRRGTVLAESAFVYPILFLLLMGIILIGLGVFRYQQVCHGAREGARYASVHGLKWATDTKNTAATPDTIFTNAIQPQLYGMAASDVSYTVTWNTNNDQFHTTITPPSSAYPNGNVVNVANTVSVTVTYQWVTGFFSPLTLSSTSVVTMSY